MALISATQENALALASMKLGVSMVKVEVLKEYPPLLLLSGGWSLRPWETPPRQPVDWASSSRTCFHQHWSSYRFMEFGAEGSAKRHTLKPSRAPAAGHLRVFCRNYFYRGCRNFRRLSHRRTSFRVLLGTALAGIRGGLNLSWNRGGEEAHSR